MYRIVLPVAIFAIFFVNTEVASAHHLPPAPRVFVSYLFGSKCPDGTNIRARLTQSEGDLWLDRDNCTDRAPLRTTLTVPLYGNSVDTDYLVYQGRFFEDALESNQPALLYCRSEIWGLFPTEKGVHVVLKTIPGSTKLNLSLSILGTALWSGVEVTPDIRPTGVTFEGKGDISKEDSLSLHLPLTGTGGTVNYSFEIGAGAISKRPVAQGSLSNLHCYRP